MEITAVTPNFACVTQMQRNRERLLEGGATRTFFG